MSNQNPPTTLLQSMKFAKQNATVSNEAGIKLFFHLRAISITEVWKSDSFYVGAEEYSFFKQKKFGSLMSSIYGKSTTWFRNMSSILQLPDGKDLYVKHGHANMVAYLAFSPENKEFVIKVAQDRPSASFHAILKKAGIEGKKEPSKDAKIAEGWKIKYSGLSKRYKKVMEENKRLKIELASIRMKQNKIKNVLSIAA